MSKGIYDRTKSKPHKTIMKTGDKSEKAMMKHTALKEAMTGETRKRAMKKIRNFESMRPAGGKTHDILKKLE